MKKMKSEKLKTLKDIYNYDNMSYVSDEAEQIINDLHKMAKEWIKFLEKESYKTYTEYPRGHFQAEILREIFNIGDENEK